MADACKIETIVCGENLWSTHVIPESVGNLFIQFLKNLINVCGATGIRDLDKLDPLYSTTEQFQLLCGIEITLYHRFIYNELIAEPERCVIASIRNNTEPLTLLLSSPVIQRSRLWSYGLLGHDTLWCGKQVPRSCSRGFPTRFMYACLTSL